MSRKTTYKNYFVLEGKYPDYLGGSYKKAYHGKINREFVKACGDLYFGEHIPVYLSIEVGVKKQVSKAVKDNKSSTNFPRLDVVVSTIIEALDGSAFLRATQISEIFAVKEHAEKDYIKVEITGGYHE